MDVFNGMTAMVEWGGGGQGRGGGRDADKD